METWPSTLPNSVLLSSFSSSFSDGRIISNMDAGPAKIRRRTTASTKPLNGSIIVNKTQLAQLETFVQTTLLGGSLPFIFPDQITNQNRVVRFAETLPNIKAITTDTYSVELSLEVLP